MGKLAFPALVVAAALVANSGSPQAAAPATAELDAFLTNSWAKAGLTPAPPADELEQLRRLTLALCGTVPSLEELRAFEAEPREGRLERTVERLLNDERFHRSWAERLARVFVGTNQGAFLVFRRDRLVDWLAEQLARNRPYDEVVRELIAGNGLWTGDPATNFITATFNDKHVDANRLAGRTMRAVLAQRMDCAQCHDHPFTDTTKQQFAALADFYEGLEISPLGLKQQHAGDAPAVPFGAAWLPAGENPRQRLAAWLTDPRNLHFSRAIANRVWGLVLGAPYRAPVDHLPPTDEPDALDLLAHDFASHGFDLRRLISQVALSAAARRASVLPRGASREEVAALWAVYPLTPLRPEQLARGLIQAGAVRTQTSGDHPLLRLAHFIQQRDFVAAYGELADDELAPRSVTTQQSLLQLNGKLVAELFKPGPFTSVGRINALTSDDDAALDALYLTVLTRRPTADERAAALPFPAEKKARGQALEDVAWALTNSPEFSWNH